VRVPSPLRPAQIFEAYCTKKSLSRDHVRFLFDGQRIKDTATPNEVRARHSLC
jgi:hypothetical protein